MADFEQGFDWAPLLNDPEPEPEPAVFDPSWPYTFKWGYDAQTGQFHMWRTKGGIDGRPWHRKELREMWGREPQVRDGDVLGVASYIPAEMKLDGTVVAPPQLEFQTYYKMPLPQEALDWAEQHFPDAVPRERALIAPKLGSDFDWAPNPIQNLVIKWVWNRDDGVMLWPTDPRNGKPDHYDKILKDWGREQTAKDFLGYAVPEGNSVEVESYAGHVPPVAVSTIKAELAKMFPDSEIVIPEYLQAGDQTLKNPSKLTRREAAAAWAQLSLGTPSDLPAKAPESLSNVTREETGTTRPPFLVRAMRRVMGVSDDWGLTDWDQWQKTNPNTGMKEEFGPVTWSGWKNAQRYVTDGQEVMLEPESYNGQFHGEGHSGLYSKFLSHYPEKNMWDLNSGWVIPTKDQMGYGVYTHGTGEGPQLHEIMRVLDKNLGKPTHFVNDWDSMRNPELYAIHPEGGHFVGLPKQP